jgi:hypothetical protein
MCEGDTVQIEALQRLSSETYYARRQEFTELCEQKRLEFERLKRR